MLNLNASLTKAGVQYSTLWSEDFTDEFFLSGLRRWLSGETVQHDLSHVRAARRLAAAGRGRGDWARAWRAELRRDKAIMGIFDEGCMGMYNAIIPDELLHPTGVFKERLSQSALYAEMRAGHRRRSAGGARSGWTRKGMRFVTGPNPETDLTDDQILEQCKMYIAALRIADDFGCDAIGIQYQQGLKDLAPASDLVEGLLNNVDRPPVRAREQRPRAVRGPARCRTSTKWTNAPGWTRWSPIASGRELGFDPGDHAARCPLRRSSTGRPRFVWVFEISGAVPPEHLIGGYAGAVSERQPPMYFRLGGGSLKGVSKPGEIVWSRIFVDDGKLKADLGRAKVVELPREETERRWRITTPQWPIMHAVIYGVTRDQLMARHKSNHIQVAYAPDAAGANLALAAKAAMFREMGIEVSVCGTEHGL